MQTECSADLFGFAAVEGRAVVAGFDGGKMTSEAGAMLLGATDRQIRLVERFAGCFSDHRTAELVEHTVARLVGQRVFGIALGYEDLNDHDHLRHDPMMAVLAGKLTARREDCAPVAGKSTVGTRTRQAWLRDASEPSVKCRKPIKRCQNRGPKGRCSEPSAILLGREEFGARAKRGILFYDGR